MRVFFYEYLTIQIGLTKKNLKVGKQKKASVRGSLLL